MIKSYGLRLKELKIVKIPSNSKLVEQFGLKAAKGHPDNTDPEHFTDPVNAVGTDNIESLQDDINKLFAEAESSRNDSGEAKDSDEDDDSE